MMRRIAVIDDQLEYGGEILPYNSRRNTYMGHQVAVIGGQAFCAKCKHVGVLAKAGGPRRINFVDAGEVALDLDIVLCACATPPRIMAQLAGNSWHDDMATEAVSMAPVTGEALAALRAASPAPCAIEAHYDEQLTLTDSKGDPLPEIYYTVRLPSGELRHGVTDSSGRTGRQATNSACSIDFYLGHRQEG